MIKTELRIIIAGSRTFSDYQLLKQTVKKVLTSNGYKTKKVAIVSGTANGADKLGERFAKEFDDSPQIGIDMVSLLVIVEIKKWLNLQ